MDELRGAHVRIADELVSRVRAAQNGNTSAPRAILLRGHSGTGKSRIIREVYDRLRADEQPSYWPSLPGAARQAARGNVDPMASRKVLSPDPRAGFQWPANALPSFGWWSFDCALLTDGGGLNVVAAARPQLDAHLLPLLLSWREAAGVGDRMMAKRQDVLEELRSAASDEMQGALANLLQYLDIAIPFSGTLLKWGWKGYRGVHRHHQNAEMLRTTVDATELVTVREEAAGEELARVILSVCHRKLPAVVVVEDMHLMGAELGTLLHAVTRNASDKPAFTIGTVWPEGETNQEFARWVDRTRDMGTAVEIIDVPPLSEADLGGILREYAPNTSPGIVSGVVRAMPNPHFLKLWLTLESTQRSIDRNGGALAASLDLSQLPTDVYRVMWSRWQELPVMVRSILMIAIASSPAGRPGDVPSFLPAIVAEISRRFGDTPSGTAGVALAQASSVSWTREIDDVTYFTEGSLAEVIRENLSSHFDIEDLASLESLGLEVRTEWLSARSNALSVPMSAQAVSVARDLTRFAEQGGRPSVAPLRLLQAHVVLGASAESLFDYAGAATEFATALSLVPVPGVEIDTMSLHERLARCQGKSGNVALAVVELAQVLTAVGEDPDDPRWILLRAEYAHWLGLAGHSDEAISILEEVEELLGARPQMDVRMIFSIRLERVVLSAKYGRVDEAVTDLSMLSEDVEGSLGPNDMLIVNCLQELGHWSGVSGDPIAAVETLERACESSSTILNVDEERLLKLRTSRSWWMCKAGLVADPVSLWQEHLTAHVAHLGALHPDTLTVRANLAFWMSRSGDMDGAIATLRDLAETRAAVLGDLHPKTLRTRMVLGHLLWKSGEPESALDVLGPLLEQRRLALGPTHPETLSTEAAHALCRWLVNPTSEGLSTARSAIAEFARVGSPSDSILVDLSALIQGADPNEESPESSPGSSNENG